VTVTTESPPIISLETSEKLKKLGTIIEIGWISPETLSLSPNNCRSIDISKTEKEELDKSVVNQGVVEHVTINENNQVVKGQLRWKSALRTGEQKIPFIRVKFNDDQAERECSFLSDTHHHPLHEDDRKSFVRKSMATGLSYEALSEKTGISDQTLRIWALTRATNIDKLDEDSANKIAEMPKNKQQTLNKIINDSEIVEDKEEVDKAISFVKTANANEVQDVGKLVAEGIPVNYESRIRKQTIKTKVIKTTVSKVVYDKFIKICKGKNEDPSDVVEDLIIQYVDNN